MIAFITGANKGIGLATARRLGQTGATVILGSRSSEKGRQAANLLRDEGIDAELVVIDVTDPASVSSAAATVREKHGRLDVLVNNAGILPEATRADERTGPVDLRMFQTTFATNVFGVVSVTEAFLPLLRQAEAGRIVNVSSTMGSLADQSDPASGYYGMVLPAYQASKAALNSITIGVAKSLAGSTVTVNAICPGWVQTDLGGDHNRVAAPTTAEDASRIVAQLALVEGADAPNGGFFDLAGPVRW
jgi:NAD(P)-dependent dehydrogenase (short-subunit alcohol dehydrogenase family)